MNNIPNVTIKIKLDSIDELQDTLKRVREITKDEIPYAQKELYIEIKKKSQVGLISRVFKKRKDTAAALTINELRKKHRLPEIPDGDITLVPISGKEKHEEK